MKAGATMERKRQLTDKYVETLRCPATKKGVRFLDPKVKGLLVWVSKTGTKTWRYRYRYHTDKHAQELTIGQFPAVDYEKAKLKALEFEQTKVAGHDPEHTQWRLRQGRTTTVEDVLDYHLERLKERNPVTHRQVSNLYKDIRKHHYDTAIADFDAALLRSWIMSNYHFRAGAGASLLRNLTAAFNRAMRPISQIPFPVGYQNPAAKLKQDIPFLAARKPGGFARTFEEDDIGRMFRAVDRAYGLEDINPMGICVIELCLMSGMRPSEASGLKWEESGRKSAGTATASLSARWTTRPSTKAKTIDVSSN
jgi:hypothetical protein